MPIETVADLHRHLRVALQIELAAIPPYLYALYSIEDEDSEAAALIRSIVVEEMLHAALVANVTLAVGGDPAFTSPDLVAGYPIELPHHEPPLELGLSPASPAVIRDVFMRLEQPEVHGASDHLDRYQSLGQFYHAVETALATLSSRIDLFADAQRSAQLSDAAYYSPVRFDAADSGGLMLVDDLESASAALEIIIHQGEGLGSHRWADPDHQELTHYFKLAQICDGTSPLGRVRPLLTNPRTSDLPELLRPASDLFNACYRSVFFVLGELFSSSEDKGPAVGSLYRLMNEILGGIARFLVTQPVDASRFAGPTFELYALDERNPWERLVELAAEARRLHPDSTDLQRAAAAIDGLSAGW